MASFNNVAASLIFYLSLNGAGRFACPLALLRPTVYRPRLHPAESNYALLVEIKFLYQSVLYDYRVYVVERDRRSEQPDQRDIR